MDPKTMNTEKPISRRKLIVYAWIGAAVVVTGELIVGSFAFLWPKKTQGKGEKVFVAGKVGDFKVGEIIYFRKEKTFIKKLEEGFLAFSAVCPHLNCIVNWNEMLKKFECPCHGATFDPRGQVLVGPPPRPLDLYKLRIIDEKLVVDTASPIVRKNFDPSQVVTG
jgi:cytochrome b6-f complex iron-sulfur subunit